MCASLVRVRVSRDTTLSRDTIATTDPNINRIVTGYNAYMIYIHYILH